MKAQQRRIEALEARTQAGRVIFVGLEEEPPADAKMTDTVINFVWRATDETQIKN